MCLNALFFEEKKSPSSGVSALKPRNLTHTTCIATNVLILSPIKSQLWLAKFEAILVPLSLLYCPFTSSGLATALIESIAEGETMNVFGIQDFDFA